MLHTLLDIASTSKYDPSVSEVEVVTPAIRPDTVGVTYKLKGIVRPLAPYFPHFMASQANKCCHPIKRLPIITKQSLHFVAIYPEWRIFLYAL